MDAGPMVPHPSLTERAHSMARKIAYIPNASPAFTGPSLMSLDAIPADVKTDVEEAYVALKGNPNGRLRATFDTKAEALQFQTMAAAYCAQRPAELGGPIRFRKSPTRGIPENVMDFRVTDIPVEAEQITAEIREAAAKAGGTPVTPAKAAKATKATKAA